LIPLSQPRIIIADDHILFSQGLKRLLEPEFNIIEIVQDGEQAIDAAKKMQPDLIIVDLSMPKLTGIETIKHIAKLNFDVRIVVLTMHNDAFYPGEAFKAGADGYILKSIAPNELIRALQIVLNGRRYLSPGLATEILRRMRSGESTARIQPTDRQCSILDLLAKGKTAKEIGAILNLNHKTVEYHKSRLMKLWDVRSSNELVRSATELGIV